MSIEIKKSQKPVKYDDAIRFMENRLLLEIDQKTNDLVWTLEHEEFTQVEQVIKKMKY